MVTVGKGDVSIRIGTEYDGKGAGAAREDIGGLGNASQPAADAIRSQWEKVTGVFETVKAKWLEFLAIYAAAAWLREAATEALNTEIAFNKLKMQVANLGTAGANLGPQIDAAIRKTSEYAIAQDADVAKSLQGLIFNSGQAEASIKNLNLVYDLAYQKGIDVSESVTLVGKAMNGNVDLLGRYIPELQNLDQRLGSNATQAQKSAYALALFEEKTRGAYESITENERRVREAEKAFKDFKEAIGGAVLFIEHHVIAALNSMAAGFMYVIGYAEKAAAWLDEMTAITRQDKEGAKYKRDLADATLAAADALGTQARHLQGSADAVNAHTEAEKKAAKSAADTAQAIKDMNTGLAEKQKQLETDIALIRTHEDEVRRTTAIELALTEDAYKRQEIQAVEYFQRRATSEHMMLVATNARIEEEIIKEAELANARIKAEENKARDSDGNINRAKLDSVAIFNVHQETVVKIMALEKEVLDAEYIYGQTRIKNETEIAAEIAAIQQKAREELARPTEAPQTKGGGNNLQGQAEYAAMQENLRALDDYYAERAVIIANAHYSEGETQIRLTKLNTDAQLSINKQSDQMRLQSYSVLVNGMTSLAGSLTTIMGSKAKEMFYINKALAIAQIFINTAMGAALAIGTLPFVGISVASAIWAMGYASMAAVAATTLMGPGASAGGGGNFSGGGSFPSGAYNGASPQVGSMPIAPAKDTGLVQNITLVINNPLSTQNWDKLIADNIAPALEKLSGDGNQPLNIRIVTV